FAIIPNLGMEAVVLPLLFLGIPVEIAGRIFLTLIVVLLGTGVVRVHRALFQRASFFPLLSFVFVFNPVFMLGFVNYLFGFALALHGFAWWLGARRKPAAAILPRLLAWTIALFFCHLMPAVLFLGLICSYEAARAVIARNRDGAGAPDFRRTLLLLAAPLLAIALLYSLAPLSTAPQTIDVHSLAEVLRRIPARLKGLPYYLIAYSRHTDLVILLALAGMMGVALRFRRLRISWPMLLPISGLLIVYLLAPERWSGTDLISYRIPIITAFLFFGSADIEWDRRYLPAMAVLAILGLRTATVLNAWAQANAQYRPMMQAMDALPERSSIYTAVNYRQSFEPLVRLPWSHFDSYAAIHKRFFVSGVWADPTQNWIVHTAKYSQREEPELVNNRVDHNKVPLTDAFSPALLANYDFLLMIHPELYQRPFPDGIRVIARSGNATLFSLHSR
ncbi:MAG TPA: hypothetical protein VN175_05350, partial [Rhizomicrobium sp.]|nr:hypothetical protein [Rhizomicrobium sp.]